MLIQMADVATNVRIHNEGFHGFKGSWILADTRSPSWHVVREMFVAMPTVPIPPPFMCVALGFPLQDENEDDEFYNKVEILDATEHTLLKDHFSQRMCRVGVLKIFCGQGGAADWERIVEYYMACRDLAAMLGTELRLDLCEYPRMRVWCWLTGRLAQSQSVMGA